MLHNFVVQLGAAGANDVFGTSDAVVKYVGPTNCCLVSVALAAAAVLSVMLPGSRGPRPGCELGILPSYVLRSEKRWAFHVLESVDQRRFNLSCPRHSDTPELMSHFFRVKLVEFRQFADLKAAKI